MPIKKAFYISLGLSLLKFVAFVLTQSSIVLASFFDSLSDSIVSYLNYYFFRKSRQAPDPEHPFGHGGYEVISSFIQGILILLLACFLFYQSIEALLVNKNQHLENYSVAIFTLSFSALGGFFIQYMLHRYAKKMAASSQRALSLDSDRAHYLTDFWTNILGALGLAIVYLTGQQQIDHFLGILAALMLVKTAIPILKNASGDILQSRLSEDELKLINEIIHKSDPMVLGIHRLRTRRVGPDIHIDFHLKLPSQVSLSDAHKVAHKTEANLHLKFPNADILIHLDPDDFPDEVDFGN